MGSRNPHSPPDDDDYFGLSTPCRASTSTSPTIPIINTAPSPSDRYLEFVPRVSSPLTSPPLSPHGDTDGHYSDVFAALAGAEGLWGHGRKRRKGGAGCIEDGEEMDSREGEDDVEEEEGGKRSRKRSLSHIPHMHLERLFHWRRSPHSTPLTPLSDSDETSSENESDFRPPGIRQRRARRYAADDDGDIDPSEADAMDLGASLRRELRERKHRRWDPTGNVERRGGGVTLAQLLAEELAFARVRETLEEREPERRTRKVEVEVVVTREEEREGDEKDEFVEGGAKECHTEEHSGFLEVPYGGSDGGHGSAEGGSDESDVSAQSGSTDSSEETSDGHGAFLKPGIPVRAKRGRSKLRRRRPPVDCVHQNRSRSEIPVRTREASLRKNDDEADVGCLPCSLGVRRSLRQLSFKLKLRRPEEISPALQALVERPMSPEEYHQYFLSLYLKEGSSSSEHSEPERSARRGQNATHPIGESGSRDRRMGFEADDSMREALGGPDHIRASTR